MKQIYRNPNPKSVEKYWTLLTLCISCFYPNEDLLPYFNYFLEEYNDCTQSSSIVKTKLDRCMASGIRKQPPTIMEIKAAEAREFMSIPLHMVDGTTKNITIDSATTAYEACSVVVDLLGLADKFGFSLFVSLDDKILSLGAGNDIILDTISDCEQEGIRRGYPVDRVPWRIFFRKEMFIPWHSASDTVATSLIYEQVIRGVHYGEYYENNEDALVLLAAQQYYVKNEGREIDVDSLEEQLLHLVPVAVQKEEFDRERWIQKIMNAYRKVSS